MQVEDVKRGEAREGKTESPANRLPQGSTVGAEAQVGVYRYPAVLERVFTEPGKNVYSMVGWSKRSIKMVDHAKGKVVYSGEDLEFPSSWSETACKITASKYFKKAKNYQETSLKQVIDRIVDTITAKGDEGNYFVDEAEREVFRDELKYIMLDQRACFNSPVLFNIGVPGERPQASACFINSVKDDMADISRLIVTEGMIFKWGSGSGVNYSTLRSEGESLSTGGTASGPLSFMKVLDANAGAIKSGGKSRRAAKMCVLNVDHPDIERFIDCKVVEEKKAHALIDAGYDASIAGEAYSTITYQNANNSVRVTDEFMEQVEKEGIWELKEVVSRKAVKEVEARKLLRKMAEAAWITGDPGIQFDTTTNDWHTCPNSGRINSSNPCSEYVFLDDSACNLSSINLLKYVDREKFKVEQFAHSVRIMILAQEILCGFAQYPNEKIRKNSHDFRPLGLGYTNLGALLMVHGIPYDSDHGRAIAAAATALMHGLANESSGWIAERVGPFEKYMDNEKPMNRVLDKHRAALVQVSVKGEPPVMFEELMQNARASWDRLCCEKIYRNGFRNSQVTLLAPTGTISFFMDAVTTGVEPELSLIKYKNLVDGSVLTLVNPLVRQSMQYMGLNENTIREAEKHIYEHGNLEDFDRMTAEQKAAFATSFGEPGKLTTLPPEAHLKMMAAVQPFLSGAISKTVNMPTDSTVEDVEKMYFDAWKQGLKSLAIYRDGCKRSQPLEAKGTKKASAPTEVATVPKRKRLPSTRRALTHKFDIAGHEGYVTAGCYDDGSLGEIFILMHKEGSILSGLLDAFGIVTSIALQYGAPLEVLVDKMIHMRFEPSGITKNKQIPIAKSIVDYIFRWLASEFLSPEKQEAIGIKNIKSPEQVLEELSRPKAAGQKPSGAGSDIEFDKLGDAPSCDNCGTLMERRGSCYTCPSCGDTSGCS
ncbi:MAG: ribonucleoside-diphosphate reductase, adenosylcobalamin-dependent [Candidatus Glassbacteria bacterium RIFCSPLOWO2_12_FULL_58_11]|uniref:Vitamin B12-dependent ribonucleotide reductase n=1 Tax=Candidatus Glassbacteria bacterium RIFCSPLOWO2_12_FULL_58_11 TaxID=1817867 RepID=A0A1F5Z2L2_9BACT|nr:MAG: ribonucleoside-diphosphate reductase, adenosylcobalamin-dependent [Candidatus Glassbacteria bacterium RIFCSPLOWO2_12_FULL_58_11]